jgi:hypothetical protein
MVPKGNRPRDPNQLAAWTVAVSTSTPSAVSEYMAEIGRRGGHIGGKRRLKTMTKAERTKVARKAAKTRWKKARHSAR